jgi:hypothetical protein
MDWKPKVLSAYPSNSHTSSRDNACLNTLIMSFEPTKGSVLPFRSPTLATVSLRKQSSSQTRQKDYYTLERGTDQTPRKPMVTSRLKALLKWSDNLWDLRFGALNINISYGNGTCSKFTLSNIPASTRAVYAPCENPVNPRQISPGLGSQYGRANRRCRSYRPCGNSEELVTVHDVLAEIPRKHQVENPGSMAENWRDDARLKVGPDNRLCEA